MRPYPLFLLSLGLTLAAASGLAAQERFSHASHRGLFPLCSGCHAVGGDGSVSFPVDDSCASCHDGDQAPTVAWTPPPPFTRLDHRFHEGTTAAEPGCGACHGGGERTAVTVIRGGCAECHAEHHDGEGIRCRACHAESPQAEHTVAAHAGCAGSGCHDAAAVSGLRFERDLCLVCHQSMVGHKPDRPCGRCHAVSQPGG